jgi:hypothetical protein
VPQAKFALTWDKAVNSDLSQVGSWYSSHYYFLQFECLQREITGVTGGKVLECFHAQSMCLILELPEMYFFYFVVTNVASSIALRNIPPLLREPFLRCKAVCRKRHRHGFCGVVAYWRLIATHPIHSAYAMSRCRDVTKTCDHLPPHNT